MERHVDVIHRETGTIIATYPIRLGTEETFARESEYLEEAKRRARDENLVEDDAEIDALRFQFAVGPR